ncbi:unnamed protein product [Pleuronectes platessa]|uniref:Uncharacterized protein n=1 Tax=Pleuronectes platessa TaxID=8262 RepID=A0A9N7VP92_PLEPL|nr:unnamed protein product [Pleuronectes platessa]
MEQQADWQMQSGVDGLGCKEGVGRTLRPQPACCSPTEALGSICWVPAAELHAQGLKGPGDYFHMKAASQQNHGKPLPALWTGWNWDGQQAAEIRTGLLAGAPQWVALRFIRDPSSPQTQLNLGPSKQVYPALEAPFLVPLSLFPRVSGPPPSS